MDTQKLQAFINASILATYAGNGKRLKPEYKPGYIELEHRDGDWYYRDSFAGFLRSWGQEIIWHQDKPVWSCAYGGGMCGEKADDAAFANKTFGFLKQAFRADKGNKFRVRGPAVLQDGDWQYKNDFSGDITNFSGHEEISFQGKLVFTHDYFGGIIRDGRPKQTANA